MKIALFGATGTIGQRILREAVQRGHDVTAIARDISKLEKTTHITPAKADLLDPNAVANVVKGHDAVINASSPSGGSMSTVVEAARSLIAGLKKASVKRLLIVGGAGSLEVAPGVMLVDSPDFPAPWKQIALAHVDALKVYKSEATDLDWSYLSPAAMIEPGDRTGKFRLGTTKFMTDDKGHSKISAEDYAVVLLDEIEKPEHVKRQFTAAY